MKVFYNEGIKESWIVSKRYNDFLVLKESLQEYFEKKKVDEQVFDPEMPGLIKRCSSRV